MKGKYPIHINYIYFGFFLILLCIISTFSVLHLKTTTTSSYAQTFFIIYSYGQLTLEVLGFALIAYFLKKYTHKKMFNIFIAFTFIFFVCHIIDFVILKIMDMTFWEGLDLALDENLENFLEMLHTTGIPYYLWIIFGIFTLSIPFIGIFLYKITDKLTIKMDFVLYHEQFMQAFFCIPLALCIWDFSTSSSITSYSYLTYQRTLPWKITFLQPKSLNIQEPVGIKKPKSEKQVIKYLSQKKLKPVNRPNIYLFIIESLREDYLTEEIAPTISQFRKENISFKHSIANANATHHSWFSLFYSEYPYLWKHIKDSNWTSGSPTLNILKKIGYSINIFSAPELKYYSMREVLFGKSNYLANIFNLYPHYHPKEAYESDKDVLNAMHHNINKNNPNIQIAFLDATHFIYSFPKDHIKFKPILENIDYINISKKDVYLIENRYKNSINYVDSLIKNFIADLKQKNLYENSIIVILGDHGEEFYDEGHLFHCSHLSAAQTKIPIYLKFPNNCKAIANNKTTICHMDVFPSIFEYIFGKNIFKSLLKGSSIFDNNSWPYVITTRYNASRTPFEFFIFKDGKKLTLRFKNNKDIFKKQHLKIVSLKNENNQMVPIPTKEDLQPFQKALEKISD